MTNHLRMARYDHAADVLYLSVSRTPAAKGIEDRDGIVWRYDSSGELIGVTIIDYRERWPGRPRQLIEELSQRFHVSVQDIERVLGDK